MIGVDNKKESEIIDNKNKKLADLLLGKNNEENQGFTLRGCTRV